jgi:hypothetical protein
MKPKKTFNSSPVNSVIELLGSLRPTTRHGAAELNENWFSVNLRPVDTATNLPALMKASAGSMIATGAGWFQRRCRGSNAWFCRSSRDTPEF